MAKCFHGTEAGCFMHRHTSKGCCKIFSKFACEIIIHETHIETMQVARKIFLLITFSFCILSSAFSQKVGVVFSGGGASGLAHIGVLKALEENNIPIDYISGASIGAYVGALYSIGYSPKQIEKIVLSEDFSNWAYGNINKKYI